MSQKQQIESMSRPIEGGVFYPVGFIVVALPEAGAAEKIAQIFHEAGYDENDCQVVSPSTMLATAEDDIQSNNVIAMLGSSLQVRRRHIELAKDGCTFLLVFAPSDAERARVLRVLSHYPVRYAIHYHRFTIEDLIAQVPSATEDSRSARRT